MHVLSRRSLLAGASAAVGAGMLSGCSGVAGGGGDASGTVRYAFWGNDLRRDNYAAAFDRMNDELPDIDVSIEFADQTPYRERMTTQMAARTVPDIFWVALVDVLTYHANGIYRRLDEVETLDLSDFSDDDIRNFEIQGELNTMPFGIQVPVVRYNRTFAEEDGVEIPEEWDWGLFADFARDYTDNNSEGRRAMTYRPDHSLSLLNWLRQNGEQLWTEDGGVGFSAENLAGWIEWWEDLRAAGATTSVGEQDGVGPSWTETGDKVLMHFGSGNHAVDESAMFPDYEFGLKHPPIATDAPERFRFIFTQRMAMYSEIDDDTIDAAGHVLGYCVNNVEILRDVGITLGTPTNPRVAQEYREFATDIELEILDIDQHDREAPRDPLYETPPGAAEWQVTLRRALEDIVHEGASISESSQRVVEEIERGINRAS